MRLDARIDKGIDHIHQQHNQAENQTQQKHAAHDDGIIAAVDRAGHVAADTGDGEHVLDDDRAAEHHAHAVADDGDNRNQRIGQRMFEQHFTNARNAGLKVGVYFFSQAVNENEAREEAQGCAYVLNGRKLDYPIYFDTEASGGSNGRADGLGVEDRTKCAIAFCEEVKAQGYQPGVYASTLWFRKRIDLNRLKSYSIWNAHYNVAGSPIACDMWQGTCTARIPGYGGQIDVNISYVG